MVIPDVNLLLYAINQDSPHHFKAKRCVEELFSSSEVVGFAWVVILAFLRLTTKAIILPHPLTVQQATECLEIWLTLPNTTIIHPGEKHFLLLRDLINKLGAGGNLTTDIHLACLAIEHDATLYSTDNDFLRFRGLSYKNPLNG